VVEFFAQSLAYRFAELEDLEASIDAWSGMEVVVKMIIDLLW
jgi:hypothetical protein